MCMNEIILIHFSWKLNSYTLTILYVCFLLNISSLNIHTQRIAKNKAKIKRWVIDFFHDVKEILFILLSTDAGSDFCFFLLPSLFWYSLYSFLIRNEVLPSLSSLGSCLLLDLKACATDKVVSTIDWTRIWWFPVLKITSRTTWANVERIIFVKSLDSIEVRALFKPDTDKERVPATPRRNSLTFGCFNRCY